MLKNVRFGVKIGAGFGLVLAILAFSALVVYFGQQQVSSRMHGVQAAKDSTIHILEARREEKNFIIRGGQEYVDKVTAAVKALGVSTTELAKVSTTADGKQQVAAISAATKDYAAAFTSYVAATATVTQVAAEMKANGERLVNDFSGSALATPFMLVRIAAVYFQKDRTEDEWKALQAALASMTPEVQRWAAAGTDRDGREAAAARFGQYAAGAAALKTQYDTLAGYDAALVSTGRAVIDNAAKAEASLDKALDTSATTMTILIFAATGGAVLLGILIALLLTRSITVPVKRAVGYAGLLAECDFRELMEVDRADEMGVLAKSLNEISVRMRAMCVSIADSAEQVSASSAQISASAQTLAQGAQSQASALEETSAAVEELSSSIEQVAEHAQSQAASGQQGTASMTQVRGSIDAIASSLDGIADLAAKSVEKSVEGAKAVGMVVDAISRISAGSERIAGIVTVISEIADQTNLLALNASIEAARAGEHGRGFAVVAEEVSKLADRSASSTKEIEALIRESVQSVGDGVRIAEGSRSSMEEIREGSQKVREMIVDLSAAMTQQVTALKDLTGAVGTISEMSQSISAATGEQSTNSRQVAKAVESVSELTQSAASAAEEMSASTVQLTGMAHALRELIANIKTGQNLEHLSASGAPALPGPTPPVLTLVS